MNAPSWSGPKASRLWSARGDERCSPPRSDDYKDWSLMQLKREITQRQLKTNPRKRNKDAFVKVLLSNDQEQTQTHKQQTLEDAVVFAPTSTSELQNMYANNGHQQQQQQNLYAGQQQRDIYYIDHQQQQQQPQIFANEMDMEAMQTSYSTPTASTRPRAARLEIDGRRLELETKREQRSSELHAVQLALAQEQLKQAKMTTQKMKTDWMVEQLIQKKRLNDAGISQEDTATLGMYLS
uniref:Uncharacterized protein n=1 Tax=Phytophthora ramorum TaxID=164328 RepID=H3GBL3_PHYRM